jgi:methyl-accepting chemotaxis protein
LALVVLLAAVSVVIAGLGLSRLATMEQRLRVLHDVNVAQTGHVADARAGLMEMYYDLIGVAAGAGQNPPGSAAALAAAAQNQQTLAPADTKVADALAAYRVGAGSSAVRLNALQTVTARLAAYVAFRDSFFLGKPAPAGITVPTDVISIVKLNTDLSSALDNLGAIEKADADGAAAAGAQDYRSSVILVLVALLVALLVGLALSITVALRVSGAIVRPLVAVAAVLTAVGSGDLTQTVAVRGRDEVARMAQAVNTATVSLRTELAELAAGAGRVGARARTRSPSARRAAPRARRGPMSGRSTWPRQPDRSPRMCRPSPTARSR